MNVKTFKTLAEQFDQVAELLTAIGGTFRAASDAGAEDNGDAPAGRKVRTGRRAPAPKPDDAISQETVKAKLVELADAKGAATMKKALESVGAGKLSDVGEDQYQELLDKVDELLNAEDAKPKPRSKKAPAIDMDSITAKFKELLAADKAAAKAVLKANGIAKLSEVDEDDADAMSELNTAIDAALEGDDDLVG